MVAITLQKPTTHQETFGLAALDWCEATQEPMYRLSKLAEQASKLTNEIFKGLGLMPSEDLEGIASGTSSVARGCSLFRVRKVCKGAYDSWKELHDSKSTMATGKKPWKFIHATAEATTTTMAASHVVLSSFAKTVPFCAPIRRVMFVSSTIDDTMAFGMSAANVCRSYTCPEKEKLEPEIKEVLEQTKVLHLLNLIKDVCGVAGAIIGVIAMVTGASPVAPIVLLTISLTATIFALVGKFYQNSMAHKPIDFFDSSHVQYQNPTA